jgi:hypothetical protein
MRTRLIPLRWALVDLLRLALDHNDAPVMIMPRLEATGTTAFA